MRKIISIAGAVIMGMSSCSKEDPMANNAYTDDFRFYVKATVDGLPLEYNAGENGYFMETDYNISDSVINMIGKIYGEGDPFRNAISIKIRGAQEYTSANSFRVEENLKSGPYAYRDQTGYKAEAGIYRLSFFGDSSAAYNYNWTFADGSTSTDKFPVKTVKLDDFEKYEVSLNSAGTLCQSTVTHHVNIAADCDATFAIKMTTYDIAKVLIKERVGNVQRVSWYWNNSNIVPNIYGEINVGSFTGYGTLRADVFFEGGCVKTIERSLPGLLATDCFTDFWYKKEKQQTYDPNQYATVEIIYYDENGKKYTSYYSDVMGDFKIISNSPYERNEKEQNTSRFFFEANVVLKNNDGSLVNLTNCFGSFAVSHP